jgi:hypothetical protein
MHSEMSELTRAVEATIVPLTDDEAERAIEVARKHLTGELSEHYRFLGAELLIEKSPEPGISPRRTVAVLAIDYQRRRTLQAVVDVAAEVLRVLDLGGFQPAFAAEEVREALEIAAGDERVGLITGRGEVATSTFMPGSQEEPRPRLIGLHLVATHQGHGERLLADVVVDLEHRTVTSVDTLPEDQTEDT